MSEAMKSLIEKIQNDKDLQEKFKACKNTAEQANLANELGFEVTAEEFDNINEKLSDEQLDEVAGGGGRGFCIINIG